MPVQVTQPSDYQLSCAQIAAEQTAIASKVNALRAEDESAHNSNIAIGVVGAVLFWPALFALDTNEAQQQEIGLYRSRSEHLNILAGQQGCLGAATPTLTTMIPEPAIQAAPAVAAPQPAAAYAPAAVAPVVPAYAPATVTPEAPAAPAQTAAQGESSCIWNAQDYHFDC